MASKFIFISCGQETAQELKLGKEIKSEVERHGMEGFLAQAVHSADELNKTVFSALQKCSGFCAVMHRRGEINYQEYSPIQRASVWIQQEIALLMYRRFSQGRPIPIRVFTQKGILLEGVMKYTIANPIEFEKDKEVLTGVTEWLRGPEFTEEPILAVREGLFQRRIQDLHPEDWYVLELIAAHSVAAGDYIRENLLEADYYQSPFAGGKDTLQARDSFQQAYRRLSKAWLITYDYAAGGQIRGIGISKEWWSLLHEEFRNRVRVS